MPAQFKLGEINKELRQLIKLGLPLAIGELSGVLMSLIDTAMIGDCGASSVAAAGVGRAVFLFLTLVGIGTVVMTAPLVATANEGADKSAVKRLLYGGAIAGVLLGAIIGIVLCVINFNFYALRQSPEVCALAVPYLWAYVIVLVYI